MSFTTVCPFLRASGPYPKRLSGVGVSDAQGEPAVTLGLPEVSPAGVCPVSPGQ